MNWILAILASIIFILLVRYYFKLKSILMPHALFTSLTLILTIFALFFEDGKFGYLGYLWIFVALLAVNLGAYISRSIKIKKINNSKRFCVDINKLKIILIFLSAMLIAVSLFRYVRSGGMSAAAQTAYDYYTTTPQAVSLASTIINQIIGISCMLSAFMGGMYLSLSNKKRRGLLSLIVFIAPVIDMLYSTQKLELILATIYYVIGVAVAYTYSDKLFTGKLVVRIIKKYWLLGVLAFALFILSFMLRFGTFNVFYLEASFQKIETYALGSYQCFNAWLSEFEQIGGEYSGGVQTFMALPHVFGWVDRSMGLYTEVYDVAVGPTNIYSAFRPLIMDYGVFGSLVFLFVIGFISGVAFKRFKQNKGNGSFFVIVVCYVYFIYSPITSPYIYFNISISFVVYLFVCDAYRLFLSLSRKNKINGIYKKEQQEAFS